MSKILMEETPFLVPCEEAERLLNEAVLSPKSEQISVPESLGRFLAEDFFADLDLPEFDRSAMDGFAFSSAEIQNTKETISLRCTGEIHAGDSSPKIPGPGECVWIATGAKLPENADCVVCMEDCSREADSVQISIEAKTSHIQKKGSYRKKGSLVFARGTQIGPLHISILSSFGRERIRVYQKIKVAIFTTGNELIRPGEKKNESHIFNSNGPLLESLLRKDWLNVEHVDHLRDDPEEITERLSSIKNEMDLIFLTGGISVGKKDYIEQALLGAGYKFLFRKVRLRPGKPFSVALADCEEQKPVVFALPGNPGAVYSIFAGLVFPFLLRCAGIKKPEAIFRVGVTETENRKKGDFTALLTVRLREMPDKETGLPFLQTLPIRSGDLSSPISADGIAFLPAANPDSKVRWIPLTVLNHC